MRMVRGWVNPAGSGRQMATRRNCGDDGARQGLFSRDDAFGALQCKEGLVFAIDRSGGETRCFDRRADGAWNRGSDGASHFR